MCGGCSSFPFKTDDRNLACNSVLNTWYTTHLLFTCYSWSYTLLRLFPYVNRTGNHVASLSLLFPVQWGVTIVIKRFIVQSFHLFAFRETEWLNVLYLFLADEKKVTESRFVRFMEGWWSKSLCFFSISHALSLSLSLSPSNTHTYNGRKNTT